MRRVVLIVEDDQDGRELLGELVSLHGFDALLAADGLAALKILETERPCVILLDLMMPRMNGWQFREAQLAKSEIQHIPVVVVSADGNVAQKASEVRAAGYVRKPLDPSAVLNAVSRFCRAGAPADVPST